MPGPRIGSGAIVAPSHWSALWAEFSIPNLAASEMFDPRSKEPGLKFAAVRVEAV
jgi:hypothetical protein